MAVLNHDLGQAGIHNVAEDKRRAERLEKAKATAASKSTVLPQGVILGQKITQHSVKLIRWVAPPSSGSKSPGTKPAPPWPPSTPCYDDESLDTVAYYLI